MNGRRIAVILVVLVLGAGVFFLVSQKRKSPEASRARMVEQFIAILPDSLDDDHIAEIRGLFYTFGEREKLGKVKPETSAAIDTELASWVDKGAIGPKELVHFMAQLGYSTYKDEPHYNLPDSSIDHPILNPNSAIVSLEFDSTQFDSTFWAEFEQWKKDNPELVDSLTQEFFTPQRRKPRN
jgi:hypothetical protein